MTFQEIVDEISELSTEERVSLITLLVESLARGNQRYDWTEFEGVGKDSADDEDPQAYINRLRSEWDHRP
jgi:hypothetical protein